MENKEREWINDTINKLESTADHISGANAGFEQTNREQASNAEAANGRNKKVWQTNVRAWWRNKRSRKGKAQTGDQE